MKIKPEICTAPVKFRALAVGDTFVLATDKNIPYLVIDTNVLGIGNGGCSVLNLNTAVVERLTMDTRVFVIEVSEATFRLVGSPV